jgi:DNA-binding MarR family transcriptional regulator
LGDVKAAVRRLVAASTLSDHLASAQDGLTLSTCEANFLNVLLQHGPLNPSRLRRLTGSNLSSGTTTGVLDRLERAGYVQRTRCVDDRRQVKIELNEDRFNARDTARAERLALVADAYDSDQLAVVADFLARLAEAEIDAVPRP